MKNVGLNVAADPFFTAAYTGVRGALIVVSADDPGIASSQNEQDNRRYAEAAGVPMLEPADPQEAYDYLLRAVEISERWRSPVFLRLTTRVCHTRSRVARRGMVPLPPPKPFFERDPKSFVMIPAYTRDAHRRLRQKLQAIAAWNESGALSEQIPGSGEVGIITSGVAYLSAREAAPNASFFKLGLTYPLPLRALRDFRARVRRCWVVEEGDPYLLQAVRAAGIEVEGQADSFRFGELNVSRVRHLLAGNTEPEPVPLPGKPPQLCPSCPQRRVFETLRQSDCIVAGDIGCHSLAALPPFEAMDTCVCTGASISLGLGLRHVLPEDQARRVVSVIGDSAFMHSGITGLIEMKSNPPATGHVVILLDNGTTAMTRLQEPPGTGRNLHGSATPSVSFESLGQALGMTNVYVLDPVKEAETLTEVLKQSLAASELTLIIARRPCLLSCGKTQMADAMTP
jgi:indolepyruvate ferredoxin oxidoreductase alpha subunit